MRRPRGVKSIETKHYEERQALFDALPKLGRRDDFHLRAEAEDVTAGVVRRLE